MLQESHNDTGLSVVYDGKKELRRFLSISWPSLLYRQNRETIMVENFPRVSPGIISSCLAELTKKNQKQNDKDNYPSCWAPHVGGTYHLHHYYLNTSIMFYLQVIGNLGADCETKSEGGRTFTVFRVAHSESYTDQAGQKHEVTQWVDCIFNDRPPVCEYLKKGTTVFVGGHAKLRTYSSEKARGFVAGVTINVRTIELIGKAPDAVPTRLFDSTGKMLDVSKYYHCPNAPEPILRDAQGRQFAVDDNGFVVPVSQVPDDAQQPTQTNG